MHICWTHSLPGTPCSPTTHLQRPPWAICTLLSALCSHRFHTFWSTITVVSDRHQLTVHPAVELSLNYKYNHRCQLKYHTGKGAVHRRCKRQSTKTDLQQCVENLMGSSLCSAAVQYNYTEQHIQTGLEWRSFLSHLFPLFRAQQGEKNGNDPGQARVTPILRFLDE